MPRKSVSVGRPPNPKFLSLKKLGVGEFGHLNGNLESHLIGTYKLLMEWGNPEYACEITMANELEGFRSLQDCFASRLKSIIKQRPNEIFNHSEPGTDYVLFV